MSDRYLRQLALLLVIAAAVLAAGLGLRDPWPADEPRFALIAKEMIDSGNWLFPHVGGVLYPDKPPLFFWFVAAFYLLTGSLKTAILLPGFVAGLGTLVLVTDLGRRLWGERAGILSGALLLALLQFPLQMKSGQIDGLLCLWTTLSLYGFCRHLLVGPDWRWYAIGGAAAGLGVITKGVGFLPYFVFLPFIVASGRDWPGVIRPPGSARWLLAPAATVLVASLWLAPMLLAVNAGTEPGLDGYRDNILFHQTVTRYADSWSHLKPPWYLLTNAVPWLWLPVTLLLPWLVPAWYRDIRDRNAAILLLGGWTVLVVLFFSLSEGKRSLYIFPAAPAFALIAGYHAAELLVRPGVRRLLLGFSSLVAVLLVAVALYVLAFPHSLHEMTANAFTVARAALALLATGIVMLVSLFIGLRRHALAAVAASLAVLWTGFGVLVAPQINAERSGQALLSALDHRVTPENIVGFVDWPEQFLLQWDRPLVHFGYRQQNGVEIRTAAAWLRADQTRRVLLPEQLLGSCIRPGQSEYVGYAHRRNWYVAGPAAVDSRCAAPTDPAAVVVNYPPPVHAEGGGLREAAKDFRVGAL